MSSPPPTPHHAPASKSLTREDKTSPSALTARSSSKPRAKSHRRPGSLRGTPTSSPMHDFILFPDVCKPSGRSPRVLAGSEDRPLSAVRSTTPSPPPAEEPQAGCACQKPASSSRKQRTVRKPRAPEFARFYDSDDSRWKGEVMPAAPMPPRLATPTLDEPEEEFYPSYLLLEERAKAYIAATKKRNIMRETTKANELTQEKH